MQIDHIAIWTDNLENEKNFYLKYFECSANEKYFNPQNHFFSYFIAFEGGPRIELMNRTDLRKKRGGETLGISHFALDLGSREKVDLMTEILENDGHKVVSKPRMTGDGYYESVVLDPEKNVIELISK
jgi:lactoylglutathione lyase